MDKKKWSTANLWGFIGIFFLLMAATRAGTPVAQTGSPANNQQGNQNAPSTQGTQSAASSTIPSTSGEPTGQAVAGFDPRDATYVIEGMNVTLANGLSEQAAAPGSASKITTRYFGNGALGDINGDGLQDLGFLLTQETGGSGIFYYAVVALRVKKSDASATGSGEIGAADEYRITNAVLIGDRIAPQPSEIRAGRFYIHYADRNLGEPMTAPPTVNISQALDINSRGLLVKVI